MGNNNLLTKSILCSIGISIAINFNSMTQASELTSPQIDQQKILSDIYTKESDKHNYQHKLAQDEQNKRDLLRNTDSEKTLFDNIDSDKIFLKDAKTQMNSKISVNKPVTNFARANAQTAPIVSKSEDSKIAIERNDNTKLKDDKQVVGYRGVAMINRYNEPAPLWTYEIFERLEQENLLMPDKNIEDKHSLNRREGAILTARAYNLNKIRIRQNDETQTIAHDINLLMNEFDVEIKSLGYNISDKVTSTKSVSNTEEKDWNVSGEIRYNFARHSGSDRYTWSDNRVRMRIYGEKKLNDYWKIHGLLESDKSHIFNRHKNARVSDHNGHIELSRIYLEGNYTWWNVPFNLELGKTYAYLADGNILDSDFDGAKIAASITPYQRYEVGIGKVNDTEHMYYAEMFKQVKNIDYLGGIYHWHNYGNPAFIYMAGTNYYTGKYTFGGMYLASDKADGSGTRGGTVFSARYSKNFAWIPHTYEFDLKYYNMAGNTYVNHTMSGLGNYMDGFSGWGAMAYYTLSENLVFSLQYYDLTDKTTEEKARTLWSEISWSF